MQVYAEARLHSRNTSAGCSTGSGLGATPNPNGLCSLPQSTVAVIDELRGQLSGTTARCCFDPSSTGGCQQDEADAAQPSPAQASGPADPDVPNGRQATHTAAGRVQTYTARAVHHKPAAPGPAGRPGSRQVHITAPDSSTQFPHRGVRSDRIAAAQSSLFTPAATQCAIAQWRQHKVLQQEKAALLQQRQCLKEQQLLSQLAATEAAASVAHDQVGGGTGSGSGMAGRQCLLRFCHSWPAMHSPPHFTVMSLPFTCVHDNDVHRACLLACLQVLQQIQHISDTAAVLQVLCSSKASFKEYLAAVAANPGQPKTVGEAGFQAHPSGK